LNGQINEVVYLLSVLLNAYLRYQYPAQYYLIFIIDLFESLRCELEKEGVDPIEKLEVWMTLLPGRHLVDDTHISQLRKIKFDY
jgi:hypothetical protein